LGQLKKNTIKKLSRPRATLPPGGRSRAARRYTSKITLDLFFWYGARQALGIR